MTGAIPLMMLVCSVPAAHASKPFAGGIEDGSWAKFQISVVGDDVDLNLEVTIKAVGTSQELGEDCQWLEIAIVDTAMSPQPEVFKVLFRVKNLKRGDVGITEAVRAWMLPRDSQQPREAGSDDLFGLRVLFPGELDDERRSDERETVDLQGNSLECGVLEGRTETALGDQIVTVTHRLLLHDIVPFGLAGFHKVIEFSQSEQRLVADGQLLETGTDAESLLPDSR